MHIAFGVDNGYAQHFGVTLASLLTNLAPGIVPWIHVVTDGLDAGNQEKIAALKSIRDFSIAYITVSLEDFRDFPLIADYITLATYFRLKLPALLPDLDKVLYLDTDLIIQGDLSPLWETPLTDEQWIAGAMDIGVKEDFLPTIGMQEKDFYFNAGVILMNLRALRQNDFENRCAEFVRRYRPAIRYVDQDILNHVCKNHVLWCDPKYNLVYSYIDKAHKLERYNSPHALNAMQRAVANPVIIHFTGGLKPWHYACRNPLACKYRHYLSLTPWKDYRYPDKTLKNFVSKNLFFFRQFYRRVLGR
ncbi:MAG: lgtC [Alphaproteobacteria bacterium]|nr:lgtC [Alphaproteobacteria bacterium]